MKDGFKPKKTEYEVRQKSEDGIICYYIYIKGTNLLRQPVIKYTSAEEANSDCASLSHGHSPGW